MSPVTNKLRASTDMKAYIFYRDICDVFIIIACNVEHNYRVMIISVQGRSILIVLECVALRPVGLILNI